MTTEPRVHLSSSDPVLTRLHASALQTIERNVAGGDAREVLCAGGDYDTPWTRDAAINCWSAVSLLDPALAERTLRAVCEPGIGGAVVAQDDQWWDQIIWVHGARRHWQITGDEAFARWAGGVALRTLDILEQRFDPDRRLYVGGAMMQDGISGYPFPAQDVNGDSSFVLDHSPSHTVMSFSTNILYAIGLEAAAELMATSDESAHERLVNRAGALRIEIRRQFRRPDGGWGYLVLPDGTLDGSQELLGLALAVEHGLLDDDETDSVIAKITRSPYGIPLVAPHFSRYSDARPGRHNVMLWPMAMGQWAVAAAIRGRHPELVRGLADLTALITSSGNDFYEVYEPLHGRVNGGWQVGRWWRSVPDQTWSATAYLRCVYEGLLGMRFGANGLSLHPYLPAGIADLELDGVSWHSRDLTIRLSGEGGMVASAIVDGQPIPPGSVVTVPAGTGPCAIDILLTPCP